MNTQEIKTERGLFAYREYGSVTAPLVVMIHGWPETSYCWHHTAQFLLDSYRIIAVDLRGTGGSNRDLDKAKYAKDQLALDVISMLDGLDIQDFFLVGHDWGGGIVQEIEMKISLRIKKLCILNFPIITNHKGQAAAYKILGQKLFNSFWYQFFLNLRELPEALIIGKEEAWIRFFMRGMENEIPEDSIQEYIRSYQVEGSVTCSANMYRTMKSDIARWETLQGQMINAPTLIIHGSRDPVIIKEYYESAEECITDVRLRSIKAGHFVMDEKPQEVATMLKEFLV